MKVRKMELEWGAAWEEAQPVQITHGAAEVHIYVLETGELCIMTIRADWRLRSSGGSDVKLILES